MVPRVQRVGWSSIARPDAFTYLQFGNVHEKSTCRRKLWGLRRLRKPTEATGVDADEPKLRKLKKIKTKFR